MAQQQNQGGARGDDDQGMAQRKRDDAAAMPGRGQEDQEPMGDLGIGRDLGEDANAEGGSIGTPGTTGAVDASDLSDANIRGDTGDLGAEPIDELEDDEVLGEAGMTDELEGEEDEDLGGPL